MTINKTARPMGKNNDWETYDHQLLWFGNKKEIKTYLNENYFYCKTIYKTYQDGYKGQTGRIYAFKSGPVSYDDCKHYEQHWVNIYTINSKPLII
jgi:hypothetical protein